MAADPQQSAPSGQSAAMQEEAQQQLQSLARKLLDLWQDHVSALAQDPALMAQALQLMAAYSPFPWTQQGMSPTGGPGFAPFANQPPGGQGPAGPFPGFPPNVPFGGFPAGGAAGPAAGPTPAAAAPDAGAGTVGELRRRLAELEGRLAELERGGAAKPARKRAARKGDGGARTRPAKGG
jgi:hypothetical protein